MLLSCKVFLKPTLKKFVFESDLRFINVWKDIKMDPFYFLDISVDDAEDVTIYPDGSWELTNVTFNSKEYKSVKFDNNKKKFYFYKDDSNIDVFNLKIEPA